MKVTQISNGRFHHFHLARQMEKHGILEKIYTGYPMFKLRDETGIPQNKIKTFPWLLAPYMKRGILGLDKWNWLNLEWAWQDHESLDKYVASHIKGPTTLIALSGCGLHSGKAVQANGGYFICDRGSSHIRFQNEILIGEYKRWGLKFQGIDPRMIEKEEAEYEISDLITVPSEFVRNSFIKQGIPVEKIVKIPYGSRIDRFKQTGKPPGDSFRVLWVGGISIRKGFFYALEAFQKLEHRNKEFIVIGELSGEIKPLLNSKNLNNVHFKGIISNDKLAQYYSTSNVFVIPSIEEGLAMVQGEALACGCPVIASTNTGAEDLFTDGREGFIVPIRSVDAITHRLQQLADDNSLRERMSQAAIKRVQSMGGWDQYGDEIANIVYKWQCTFFKQI